MNRKDCGYHIGIDEAGRGPLAGPVVVAGVKMNPRIAKKLLSGIKDSKQLTARQREAWFYRLTNHPRVEYAVARLTPATIDRINILQATLLGARRVYAKLSPDHAHRVLLDGGLYLPYEIDQETIIKGDELITLISAASVIAKVTRDRLMRRLHRQYPAYRFDLHKGYGTKLHRQMIGLHGRCIIHRRSFRFDNIIKA